MLHSTMISDQRILICGDRHWTDYQMISDIIAWRRPSLIIEGGATGADSCAREAAQAQNIPYLEFRAKWESYGKAAGPIRNQEMLDEGKPDMVIAFHDDLENSKGTKDMIRRAKKADIPAWVYTHQPPITTSATAL